MLVDYSLCGYFCWCATGMMILKFGIEPIINEIILIKLICCLLVLSNNNAAFLTPLLSSLSVEQRVSQIVCLFVI